MVDQGHEFVFFLGVHVRTNVSIDHQIGKQVILEGLSHMILIKQMLVMSWQNHMTLKNFYNFVLARAMITKFGQNNYEDTAIKLRLTSTLVMT